MRHDLMTVKIEIHPSAVRAPFTAAQKRPVKMPRLFQIMNREREMKTGYT